MTLRIVIADDHSVVLHGLKAVIALEPDLEVVATATDGVEAMESVELHRPDVLVLDYAMPRCDGLEAHETLRKHGHRVPTVLIAATLTDETVLHCLTSSVEGIVLKESAASVLVDAIRAVARGMRWVPPELTARALEAVKRQADEFESDLTPREKTIAIEVAEGKSNKRVAADLGIAESTVKLHLHGAFTKLGVANRVQLSLLARARGWI